MKYRKKPVEVEAIQWKETNLQEIFWKSPKETYFFTDDDGIDWKLDKKAGTMKFIIKENR